MDTPALQQRLKALGYDPGPIDGAFGRSTIAAIKAFQKAHGLVADGVVGPKTVTLLAPAVMQANGVDPSSGYKPVGLVPPWLAEARRKTGLTEKKDRSILMKWLASDGHTLGDPSKIPWCGDFVETCIALTLPDETLPSNPYYAQNWVAFGRKVDPALGAILVFRRPGGGHVGFYEGEGRSTYSVRGGNQSNAISVARIAKSRCIAVRWPIAAPLPAGGAVSSTLTGKVSTNEI